MNPKDFSVEARLERIENALPQVVLALDGLRHDNQNRNVGLSEQTLASLRDAASTLGIELPSEPSVPV
jgi:hypothetical protein